MTADPKPATPSEAPVLDQAAAALVDTLNEARASLLERARASQEEAFIEALDAMAHVRGFIGSPESILGSQATKHGEIAEVVEVGLTRARDLIDGVPASATFEGVQRTAPADYLVNAVEVQSKFINGPSAGLGHVARHLEKYPQFAEGGRFYHVPRDQFEQVQRVIGGQETVLSPRTQDAILQKVRALEAETGRAFDDLVRPANSTYAEVQQGRVHETLELREGELFERNDQRLDQIAQDHAASFGEGAAVAAGAGVVGAAVGLLGSLFAKHKAGKNVFRGDFSVEDWQEVGLDTLKSGALGAVSGAALYALTNCAQLSAPFAGAVVSAAKGVGTLVAAYQRGDITQGELVDNGLLVCAEAALVAVGAMVAQQLIPVPVLGAVVGSVAGKLLAHLLSRLVRGAEDAIGSTLSEALAKLDSMSKAALDEIGEGVQALGDLAEAAFDSQRNEQLLGASVTLALAHGVRPTVLLASHEDVDRYMLE